MRFQKFPADLPPPQSFLRAGIPFPSTMPPVAKRRVVTEGTPGDRDGDPHLEADGQDPSPGHGAAATVVTDQSGAPVRLLWSTSHQYLTRPVHTRWTRKEIDSIERQPSGVLHLSVGTKEPIKVYPPPAPPDPASSRVVTFDSSVLLAGIQPQLFEPDDVLFISMALFLDAAVTLTTGRQDERHTASHLWDHTEPVPLDPYVVRTYRWLCNQDDAPTVLWRKEPLDRTDLLCAATSILYDAPLYTTDKTKYAGLRGLRTLEYRRRRNPDG